MGEPSADKVEATVLEIQRMSTEDGPGIRTTVFFKGCSLKCSWCHNPESIARRPQLHWIGNRCIGCLSCREVCPQQALSLDESGMHIDRSRCEGCGTCAEECPSTALALMGESWELQALVDEVIKDRVYFEKSNGGITISGGEPCLQPRFAAAFLKELKEKGVQTALDTCGLCSREALSAILPYATLVLFDLKEMDDSKHRQFTGSSNARILSNLKFVSEFIRSHVHPKAIWIRTPIIPAATDTETNIRAVGAFISDNLPGIVERWELCAFNNLCQDKYQRLDLEWAFSDAPLITKARMEQLAAVARQSGVNPDIVHWSGSTRLESDDGAEKEESESPLQDVSKSYLGA